MRKYKLISALAEETAKEVVRNEENWRRYLNTASKLYKYPFKDVLMIRRLQKCEYSVAAKPSVRKNGNHLSG